MGKSDNNIYKAYKKEFEYSYTLGAFPTMELINSRPQCIREVFIHSKYDGSLDFEEVCKKHKIKITYDDKVFGRLSKKESHFVAAAFDKFYSELDFSKNHVVLVNPSDMGNLGTIIRTLLGLGIKDLAIITPCADVFNPKTIRASMGAIFKMRIKLYDCFEDYKKVADAREYYPFMLDGDKTLSIEDCPKSSRFSLIFGNEASGLDAEFKNVGTSIFIPQTEDVDSLNLPISVGIGAFIFISKNSK